MMKSSGPTDWWSELHTLTFDSHLAVLDSVTGMGVLVLPDPVRCPELRVLELFGDRADSIAGWWFGEDNSEYSAALCRLSEVGWELPVNDDGVAAWFDAGRTPCCGRLTISLTARDLDDDGLPAPQLLRASEQMHEAAATLCSCHVHQSRH